MKAALRTTARLVGFAALGALAASAPTRAAEPNESGAGKVCGTLRSFEGETQVFDYTRTHLGDASFGTKLHCGDWVSVEKGKTTLELLAGAAISADGNTFFQILDPQAGDNPDAAHLALYRGEFVAQATNGEIRVVTPNAIARIAKGGALVIYSGVSEESQLVGLGAESSLENRFFPKPRMSAGFAKVVAFANPVERLMPDEARYVNARELNERLAELGISPAVRDAVEKAVRDGVKTKLPVSLATTARKVPTVAVRAEGSGEFNRAPASLAPPRSAPSKPRAVAKKRKVSDEPDFALKRRSQDETEKRKLLQALSMMRPDDGP